MNFDPTVFDLSADHRTLFDDANAALDALRERRRSRIAATEFPGLLSWAFESFLQLGLARIVSIADGAASEWNSRRVLNCVVLSRALLETVGAWFRVLDATYKLLPTEDIRQIHSTLLVALFGNRYPNADGSLPQAVNALTGIAHLEHAIPGTRAIYDAICEYVHPNSDGYWLFADQTDTATFELTHDLAGSARANFSPTLGALPYLSFSVEMLDRYEELFREKVEMLDRKFGRVADNWPGEWTAEWLKKQ